MPRGFGSRRSPTISDSPGMFAVPAIECQARGGSRDDVLLSDETNTGALGAGGQMHRKRYFMRPRFAAQVGVWPTLRWDRFYKITWRPVDS